MVSPLNTQPDPAVDGAELILKAGDVKALFRHIDALEETLKRVKFEQHHIPTEPVTLWYRNHRGEISLRTILPSYIRFDSTEWHPTPQWLVRAYDVDKDAMRDFALSDFLGFTPKAPVGLHSDPKNHEELTKIMAGN